MKSLTMIIGILCCSLILIAEAIIPGGLSRIPANDINMLLALLPLEREMDYRLNSPKIHRIVRIRRAYLQIVSGIKYYVDFDFHETNCFKEEKWNPLLCRIIGKNHVCHAQIWVQAWK
ncbi:hypothetical protein BLA29_003473, partial [Euroglyphus maynei]